LIVTGSARAGIAIKNKRQIKTVTRATLRRERLLWDCGRVKLIYPMDTLNDQETPAARRFL
jgi:hypothetical protein